MSNITERTFDFVVVGGGTAGIALAARLSENPNFTVAVIEAGEYITDMQSILVPGMAKMAHGNTRVDWNFYTVPQPGLKNRKIFQPRGKLIGGSSALNYMAWGRASKEEYDALAAMGNPGWSWDEFLPYMKKVEGHIDPLPETATKYKTEGTLDLYHGKAGPIKKSFHPTFNELHVPFLESLVECGLPWNPDTGSGMNSGTYTGALNIDPVTATRSYAATGYYEPVKDAKNLFVFTETQATRVLFETAADGTLIATGVEVDHKGNKFTLNARKEVTLSAGSYKTPPLLELSGIGKADILKKNGIQQLLELPVGENLQAC
ncbi:hypothetical protein VKT23_014215 [Stygiomarasmius scandens]|uniref:Glucose-methanol-choline oxidoreductase N-terminal domain-containing protein n=1 Tax=Marasmiellus scandens TaxID=2682957 RepID=A0ABR1J5H9_9AGAR